jgi:4-amino-4-deoxy-L-arabinose transferase-like glycosyltransferase
LSSRLARLASDRATLVAMLLLAVFALLEVGSLRHQTLTVDERGHYAYGWQLLRLDSTRFDESKMPVAMLNALPRGLASALHPGSLRHRLEGVEFARYVTVVCAVLLGWLVFRWARALYGALAGLLALTVFVFDPNILAHSGLVTTDLYAAWTICLAVWAFWRLLNHEGPGMWRAATVGAALFGLAQLAKYTSAYLAPILLLIALGHGLPEWWAMLRAGDRRALVARGVTGLKIGLLYVAGFLVVVNAGYWGQRTLQPVTSYHFRSHAFQQAQRVLAAVPELRMPVPAAYVEGMDWVLSIERGHGSLTNPYLLGEVGRDNVAGRRFPEYYAVAWLVKEPIATQLLLLLAVGAYLARRRQFHFRRNEWFLACPVLFFASYLTLAFNMQIGYRFALPALPFLFVFTGSLARDAAAMRRSSRLLIGGLLLYLVGSTLSYYPHFIPYFNELVWNRTNAYRIMADSNLAWSQDGWYVTRYLRRHPDALFEPVDPQVGTVLLSANKYAGLRDVERYRWIRENFEPVGHVAHGHLVFRVTPEALRRVTDPVPADGADKGY